MQNSSIYPWAEKSTIGGVITGTILYLPLFVSGSIHLIGSGDLPLHRAIVAIVVGVAYHIYSVIRQTK